MNRLVLNVFGGAIIAVSLLFVFCAPTISPFDSADNSAVTLVFKDSHGNVIPADKGYTDTVGNTVQIGVCPVFYSYIDSAKIQISRIDNSASLVDVDSLKMFNKISSETDTQWHVVTFKAAGARIVKAIGYINNGRAPYVQGTIIIYSKTLENVPLNSGITLVVKDSRGKVAPLAQGLSDTVGNPVQIGVCPILYSFIDSAWIRISRTDNNTSLVDADSFRSFKKFASETDTQWYGVTFKTPGERTIKAKAFINNEDIRNAQGAIGVYSQTPITSTNHKPIITPTSTNAQRNGSAIITLSATDPDTNVLSGWQITKGPLHGTQVPNPALPTILYTPEKDYIGKDTISYTVSDGKLTSDVGVLIITVDSSKIAPLIATQPRDTTVYGGTSITLKVETNECFPTPTFKWYKFGTPVSICSTQTFTKNSITAADSGNYCVIVENAAGTVTSAVAHVIVNMLQLTVVAGTGGTITVPTVSPQGVSYGVATAITAAPVVGYDFVNWTVTTGKVMIADSGSASTKVTLSSGDAAVTANFVIKSYALIMTVTPLQTGTVSVSPAGPSYPHGTVVTLTPTAAAGYTFNSWSGDASGSTKPLTITMNGPKSVSANFTPITYSVTYDANGASSGNIPGNQTKHFNVELTLQKNSGDLKLSGGYNFAGWNTASNGSGIDYAEGAGYPTNAPLTLYAKWVNWIVTDISLTDPDGNVYTTVVIGTQRWMAQNLKTTRYKDGKAIPLVTDNNQWSTLDGPGYCWYGNEISNKATYGALYNWHVVAPSNADKIAPDNWRVPTDADWATLTDYLSGDPSKLAQLSALLGGERNIDGTFRFQSTYACWWSATENPDASRPWVRSLTDAATNFSRYYTDKRCGFWVRLIRK
jgi:uncharacterized protein (TIGR02145 family)/uncharacterized repeat protein (TIGR02543 family)